MKEVYLIPRINGLDYKELRIDDIGNNFVLINNFDNKKYLAKFEIVKNSMHCESLECQKCICTTCFIKELTKDLTVEYSLTIDGYEICINCEDILCYAIDDDYETFCIRMLLIEEIK